MSESVSMRLLDALCDHVYAKRQQWRGVIPEVSIRDERGQRRADAMVFWTREHWSAIEIKRKLSSLVDELARPEKYALWTDYAHEFIYLIPDADVAEALKVVPERFGVASALPGPFTIHRHGATNATPRPWPAETWLRLAMRSGRQSYALRGWELPGYHVADSLTRYPPGASAGR